MLPEKQQVIRQARVHNFSAGPAGMRTEVMKTAQAEFTDWHGTGMGFMEQSHRDANGPVQMVMEQCRNNIKEMFEVPDNYHILFMHGGAHAQFSGVPLNISKPGDKACYLNSGAWASRAALHGKQFVDIDMVGEVTDGVTDPATWGATDDHSFVHVCLNETIVGVEILDDDFSGLGPDAVVIADATSTLGSRPIDWTHYGAVYASSGKNLGPAGLCTVIVRDDLLQRDPHPMCPPMMDWRLSAFSEPIPNIYNTPPTFNIYMLNLVLEDYKARGGLKAMAAQAEEMSGLVYDAIDNSDGFYTNNIKPEFRSRMTIPLNIGAPETNRALENKFANVGTANGLHQLHGHPLYGGVRVCTYNGITREAVDAAIDFMGEFQREHQDEAILR